ncbi:cell surface glycoprotein 1-like isoform X1 [Homarus americanus]|uniref:cell surface glycoprotein 1-like isoform X1 n=1 Tax=Homarus americanus TaxID=6706 RepID=UPI001C46F2C7|nr:cell surface glycoprotein 1-like isoform X1 [Homarus americanus]
MVIRSPTVLTLLLVVGAVTCSPVPSDQPAFTAHDAAQVDVTHEIRHVTFEVSEEVSEATASSQVPSGEPPEDDPPIPTATTPPTSPEAHSHPEAPALNVHSTHHQQGTQSTETNPESTPFIEKLLEDSQSTEDHPDDSQSTEKLLEDSQSTEDNPDDSQSKENQPEHPEPLQNQPDVEFQEHQPDEVAEGAVHEAEGGDKNSPEQDTTAGAHTEVIVDHVVAGEADTTSVGAEESTAGGEGEHHVALSETLAGEANGDDTHHNAGEGELMKQIHQPVKGSEEHEGADEHVTGEHKDTTLKVIDPVKDLDSEESDEQVETKSQEEVPSFVMDSSAPIDIVERSDTDDTVHHASEAVAETIPQETRVLPPEGLTAETIRKSRVYIQDPREDSEEMTQAEKSTVLEKVNNVPKLANRGLEIMSMTSPTPEGPPEGAPTDELETEEEAPPSDEEIETSALSAEDDPEANNTTVVVEEPVSSEEEDGVLPETVSETIPETVSEETEEDEPVVVPEVVPVVPDTHDLPSPSSAPLPNEEDTDNYGDPLDSDNDNLPDFDVTKEELPSKEHPLPEVTAELPIHPRDQSEKVDEEESSDLAAGDHTLEVEAGTSWVLPPQQEKVSAVAPEALTPGCIVGIVFGVLFSLVILLGVGGFVVWQRRTLNRPKVLGSDRGYAGSDSGGYIDDQGQTPQASQPEQAQQVPQVLIHLKNLKPSLPQGMGDKLKKSLPTMPKIAPMNLPNIGQVFTKRESGGSNQPGQ